MMSIYGRSREARQKSKIPLNFYLAFSVLIFAFSIFMASVAFASETNGTIAGGGNNGYAWSNQVGWVNFAATNGNINITDSGIVGYAWNANYGWINMSPTNGGITIATNGALSGYAWGSGLGWINFSSVSINSSGKFVGTASGTTVGTLTFDCANCSVVTDFRPQNFRAVLLPPVTPPVTPSVTPSATGTVNPSFMATTLPSHIDAFNAPLEILRSQSGSLAQGFRNDTSIALKVPREVSTNKSLRFIVRAQLVDADVFLQKEISIISNTLFDVIAIDQDENIVHSFLQPIQIALVFPEQFHGRTDLGVYFFNEDLQMWEKIPNAEFINNYTRFFVEHLTLFGVFSGLNLPQFIEPFFPIPRETGISEGAPEERAGVSAPSRITEIEKEEGGGVFEGGVPEEIREEFLPAQLFDINLEIENTKIAGLKDLVVRVLFTSFGRVPTLVDLTFDILNESGEKVYSAKDDITVQTQAVLTKRFADAENILGTGKYTVLVTTVYNTDVVDEFRQDFEIAGEGAIKKPFWRSLWFWGVSTIFLIIIFIVVVKRSKDDEEYKGE